MIRPSLMRDVMQALSSHRYFSAEDFRISEFANKNGEPCVRVEYRYDPQLSFQFHVPKGRTKIGDYDEKYQFNTTVRPGRQSVEETINAAERTGLIEEIREWLKRVEEDVVSVPVVRRLEAQASAIDQLRDRLDAIPSELLSEQEVRSVRDGLDTLRNELTTQLNQQTQDKDQLKKAVADLTADIEFLKRTLESMTKQKWGELFAVRVRKWSEQLSLKRLAAGTRVLKFLLPAHSTELEAAATTIDGFAEALDSTAAKNEKTKEEVAAG